jgi:chloramphenicol-sensitive protein RarD
MWGLFPLYWPLLDAAGALEIMAHRIVWSLVAVAAVLAVRRRLAGPLRLAGGRRPLLMLSLAAVVIGVNWTVYIYGVNSEQVVETSLGYYVNPLVTVLLGVFVLGERLRRTQWVALALAAVAVAVLTVDYGRPPWIALALALSFACYSLLKKQARARAVESLAVETTVLAPVALAYLVVLGVAGDGTFTSEGAGHAGLLMLSGVVTAVPLVLFGAAATRVPLTVLGLLQYLAPTLQFLTGVLVYDEPMPAVRLLGFALVWAALIVFTLDALVNRRRRTLRLAVEAPA